MSPAEQFPSLTSPGSNVLTDLVGDPIGAGLRIAMNGNQFMAVPELMSAWAAHRADAPTVFYQTLPPGLLVQQVQSRGIAIGTLLLTLLPDVITAGPDMLEPLAAEGLVRAPRNYASNDLSMLVTGSAPVTALADLGLPGVRVAMPDPATEGVGRLIVAALRAAGGADLVESVMDAKVTSGQTLLTRIHHRESVEWLSQGLVDVAPMWTTEVTYHCDRRTELCRVDIDPAHNQTGTYSVAVVNGTGREAWAERFAEFMVGDVAAQIYAAHGFRPAPAADTTP